MKNPIKMRGGKRAFKARDYLTRTSVRFGEDMEIQEALNILLEKNVQGGPVFDKIGNLVGILTDKDCLRAALAAGYYGELGGKVAEYMSEIAIIDAEADILDVAKEFMRSPHHYFPVLKEGRFVGNIARREVLKAIALLREEAP